MFYINNTGEHLKPEYNIVTKYGKYASILIDESKTAYQFYDETIQKILPLKFHEISETSNGLAVVKYNGKCGYVDGNGKEITQIKYDTAEPFDGERAEVSKGYVKSIINKNGTEIIPFKYSVIGKFSEGLAYVVSFHFDLEDDKFGFINENGKEVIPQIYNKVLSFKKGIARVSIGEDEFYINKKGERIK
jgi:hypothetical protein